MLSSAGFVFAQCSGQLSCYQAAAQAYANAANQCQNAGGNAACLRQFASYYQSCGDACGSPPSCTPLCTGGGGATGALGSAMSPAMTTAQRAVAADQNKVQQVDNLVNMGISLFSMFESNKSSAPPADSAPAPDPAAAAAAAAAAQQQLYNAEAASILADANAYMASDSAAPAPAQPDPNATLDNLLDDNNQPTDSSTAEVTDLLGGDNSQPDSGTAADSPASSTPDPNATLSNLLTPDSSSTTDTAAATTALPSPPPDQSIPQDVAPPDPATDSAMQESVDQRTPDAAQTLGQMFQSSVVQPVENELSSLDASGKTLISSVMNDPIVQWSVSDQGELDTIPVAPSGTDPDTAVNAVFGQAIVNFGTLAKGVAGGSFGWADAQYRAGTRLLNAFGAEMGLATADLDGGDSQ